MGGHHHPEATGAHGGAQSAASAAHGAGHGAAHGGEHGGHHHHHNASPRVTNSVIDYFIPDEGRHVSDFKAPDWRIYKVENTTELLDVQQKLAKVGLKDPWLRNEVWRYDARFGYVEPRRLMLRGAGTGMKWGLVLAVSAIALKAGYQKLFGKPDAHEHHHAHH